MHRPHKETNRTGKSDTIGNVRRIAPLDPSDPRSLDHPSHKEQWLELARALGRMEAREEYERSQASRKGTRR
jgi:hypothetical protein